MRLALAVAARHWFARCRLGAVALLALVGAAVTSVAMSQTVDVALNVRYNITGDANSGGVWRLVAKSSPATFGIAGLQVRLTQQSVLGSPSAAGSSGTVNGTHDAGFSIFEDMTVGAEKWFIVGQRARLEPLALGQEQSIFYGAGTLNNGAPNFPGKPGGTSSIGPAFSTLTDTARIPWATPLDTLNDPEWITAVGLVSGSFAAGNQPSIVGGSANVYTSLGTATTVGSIVGVTGASFNFSHPLRIVGGVGGDYNNNGIVDAADYSVWRDHDGQSFQLLNEGPDTPGQVTIEDYNYWKANFGQVLPGTASGGAGPVAVPEPGALALLAGALGILIFRPKTRDFSHVFGPVKKASFNVETA